MCACLYAPARMDRFSINNSCQCEYTLSDNRSSLSCNSDRIEKLGSDTRRTSNSDKFGEGRRSHPARKAQDLPNFSESAVTGRGKLGSSFGGVVFKGSHLPEHRKDIHRQQYINQGKGTNQSVKCSVHEADSRGSQVGQSYYSPYGYRQLTARDTCVNRQCACNGDKLVHTEVVCLLCRCKTCVTRKANCGIVDEQTRSVTSQATICARPLCKNEHSLPFGNTKKEEKQISAEEGCVYLRRYTMGDDEFQSECNSGIGGEVKLVNSDPVSGDKQVSSGPESEARLANSGPESESRLVSSEPESEARLVSSGPDSEAKLVNSGPESEARLVSSGPESEARLVSSGPESKARLVNSGRNSLDSNASDNILCCSQSTLNSSSLCDITSVSSAASCNSTARETTTSRMRFELRHGRHQHDNGVEEYLTPLQRRDRDIKLLRKEKSQVMRESEEKDAEIAALKHTLETIKGQMEKEREAEMKVVLKQLKATESDNLEQMKELCSVQEELIKMDAKYLVLKREMSDKEEKFEEYLLDMYKKGQSAAMFERDQELEMLATGQKTPVSVRELTRKLSRTEMELAKWQGLKLGESYAQPDLPDTQADATLSFLKDAFFHFWTDKSDNADHLRAIIKIFKYSETQMTKLRKGIDDFKPLEMKRLFHK